MRRIASKITAFVLAAFSLAMLLVFLWSADRQVLSPVHAAGGALSGWTWSDAPGGLPGSGSGAGWISFSSRNCDSDGDGFSGPGAPDGCPIEGTALALYQVLVDSSGGMSRYAWTEYLGWISFDPSATSGCPAGSCPATLDIHTGAVSGWARVCAVFANGCSGALRSESERGGWEGWISLSCANAEVCATSNYGVSVGSGDPCEWGGWAWGDTNLGWIHFKGPTYGVKGTGDACALLPPPPIIDQPNGVINATDFDVQLRVE